MPTVWTMPQKAAVSQWEKVTTVGDLRLEKERHSGGNECNSITS